MIRLLLEQVANSESEFEEMLQALVLHESPTESKGACDSFADRLAGVFAAEGIGVERVSRDVVGDILLGRIRGGTGRSTLLLCHYDTVWPVGTLASMPFYRDGDYLYGPGALDMKAGIVASIQALKAVAQSGLALIGDVTILVTSDEETGAAHSRELIEQIALDHDRVFVLEPSTENGELKVERKGSATFEFEVKGVSAHAGNNPGQGASALRELAQLLFFVESLADDATGTSANLTVAQSGVAANVIPDKALGRADVRVRTQTEADRVRSAILGYGVRDPRTELTVSGGFVRPPMEATHRNLELLSSAKDVMAAFGLAIEGVSVGGGSDGCFTSAIGVPTLDGLGAVGAGIHARNEHIRVGQTLERVALLAALLADN